MKRKFIMITIVLSFLIFFFFLSPRPLSLPSSSGNGRCSDCEYILCIASGAVCTAVADTATNESWSFTEVTGASAYDTAIINSLPGSPAPIPSGSVSYYLYTDNYCGGSTNSSGPSSTDEVTSLNMKTWPNQVTLDSFGNVPPSQDTGPLPAGSYSFLAVYSGGGDYDPEISCALFLVYPINTAVFDASTSAAWSDSELTGASAYDTANVTEPGTTPAANGTVTYYLYTDDDCGYYLAPGTDEVTSLNTYTWPQTVTLSSGNVPNSQPTGPLAAGTYSFLAVYSGGNGYPGGSSCSAPFRVIGISTAVFDASTSAPWSGTEFTGASAIDTSAVTGGVFDPITQEYITPAGTVTYNFYSDGTCGASPGSSADLVWSETVTVGSVSLGVVPNSQATGTLTAGSYSFQAVFTGTGIDYGGVTYTSGCEPFTVLSSISTTSTVVYDASTNAAWSGSEFTGASAYDTATVTGVSGFTPTGTVTFNFYTGSVCGGSPASTQTVTLSGGTAESSSTGSLVPGSYSYQTSYSGDNNYAASTSSCESFAVQKAQSTISTTIEPSSSVLLGTPTYDTATIGGTVSGYSPTGTVSYSFYTGSVCGGSPASTQTVTLSGGAVPQSNSQKLPPGTYSYSAAYSGDSNYYGATSGCEPLAVQTPTTSLLVCSPYPSTVGVPETCTVIVVNNDLLYFARSTGSVTFSGTLPPGMPTSCTLTGGTGDLNSCSVSWTPAKGTEGSYSISAFYSGDITHAASSTKSGLTITKRSVSVSVSCSGPYQVNTPTTFTVTVTDNSPGTPITPSGTVTFSSSGPGSFSSSSCTLSGTGATASCKVTFTPTFSSSYTVSASYGGDTDHYAGSGSTTFKVKS